MEHPESAPAAPPSPRARDAGHRTGFVALVGLPGAGKSTLLNRLVGERLAIVSRKPQTTRRRILGVARRPGLELILLDTPGIHRPKTGLGRAMMRAVNRSLGGADVAVAVVDGTQPVTAESGALLRRLHGFPGPTIIGINKTDAAPPARVRELSAFYRGRKAGEVVAFSARTGAGVEGGEPAGPADPADPAGGAGTSLVGMLGERVPSGPAPLRGGPDHRPSGSLFRFGDRAGTDACEPPPRSAARGGGSDRGVRRRIGSGANRGVAPRGPGLPARHRHRPLRPDAETHRNRSAPGDRSAPRAPRFPRSAGPGSRGLARQSGHPPRTPRLTGFEAQGLTDRGVRPNLRALGTGRLRRYFRIRVSLSC